MTHSNKQEFQAWAFDNLLAYTTRGLLAEYIVAKATRRTGTETRMEPVRPQGRRHRCGGEVGCYVQAWKQARPSVISLTALTEFPH